jgi:hypothetical protein
VKLQAAPSNQSKDKEEHKAVDLSTDSDVEAYEDSNDINFRAKPLTQQNESSNSIQVYSGVRHDKTRLMNGFISHYIDDLKNSP